MDRPVCFSVVTICYNCEHEIEATLLSVLNQTYADVDYVIIDGKSSDGSMLIVNKYRERIATVVSEPDSGIYNAMNKGLSHCKGDYVIFMNAGDVFASDDVLARLNDIILMQEMRPSSFMAPIWKAGVERKFPTATIVSVGMECSLRIKPWLTTWILCELKASVMMRLIVSLPIINSR